MAVVWGTAGRPAARRPSRFPAALAAFLLLLWLAARHLREVEAALGFADAVRWILDTYSERLDDRPLATKMFMTALLFLLSDSTVQAFTTAHYSPLRAYRFTVYGALVAAPLLHFWHIFLDMLFIPQPGELHTAVMAALTNQLYLTPTYTALYFAYDALSTGRPFSHAVRALRLHGWRIMVTTWIFWLPANTINFAFLPLRHRVLYITGLGVLWNAYFAYATHKCLRPGSPPTAHRAPLPGPRIPQPRPARSLLSTPRYAEAQGHGLHRRASACPTPRALSPRAPAIPVVSARA